MAITRSKQEAHVDGNGGNGSRYVFGRSRLNAAARVALRLTLALCGLFMLAQQSAWAGCFKGRCSPPSATIAVPVYNATYGSTQSIVVSGRASGQYVVDPDGDFFYFRVTRVDVYNGATLVGTATLGAAGFDDFEREWRDFSYTLAPLAAGAYTLKVQPIDNQGAAGAFREVNVTVASSNASPTVSLASPSDGALVAVNQPVNLTSSASDSDGTVTGVRYFDGATAISGVLTTAPYTFAWTPTTLNAHSLKAVATDNSGASTTSASIAVTVNDAPVATLSVSNVASQNPGSITLQATATDSVGGLDTVRYFANGSLLPANVFLAPFTYNWTGVGPGTYSIVVRATDVYGAFTNSAPYVWTVNAAPSVSIASPASGAVSTAPASFNFTASASDSDGSVSSVQWFANGSAISGPLTGAPYTFAWSAVAAGSYSITARASDNASGLTTSSPITVISNDRPTVSLAPSSPSVQAPGSITLQASASDSLGGVSSVQYFANGSAISGSLTSAPYNFNWGNVGRGSYSVIARATDAYGASNDSAAYAFSVNTAPSVTLAAPANGTVITSGVPATISMAADAADSDGSITKVEFLSGTTVIGTLTTAPYQFTWPGVVAGTYSLSARATDNNGGVTTSAAASVRVNALPTATISSSASTTVAPGSFTLAATATDSDGTITQVEFLSNGTVINTATATPYSYAWSGVGVGSYSVAARATDSNGQQTTSAPITVAVSANQLPAVSLSQPASGAVVAGPTASIAMAATASDSDGTITKVEFLVNGSIVASVSAAPFTATWSATAAGTYSVQARATDDAGGSADSAIAVVSVDAPPTVAITSPANGATFFQGVDVPVAVSAADSDGSIAKVEVYDGATLIATLTSGPFNTTLLNASAGTHVLTATAYDNQGAITTSASVSIDVAVASEVAASILPLTSGSGTPGKVAGSLGVSSSGASQYTIPIAIAPGSAGMVPSIALRYDSSAGNGVAGVGWSIVGLSQIRRCARDFAHEGFKAGVDLSTNDRFCLDGQRLILVPGTGAYGEANSEYRTEIDRFSKIVAVGIRGNGPDSFLVTLRDGTRFEYGKTADSQLMLPAASAGQPLPEPMSTTPIAWSVNKVTDPRSNFYVVTYTTVPFTGQQAPSRIDYTGNAAAALAPYNSVQFFYETSRADVETRYVLGAKIINSYRLTNITTYAGATFVKDYRIAYDSSAPTSRSRVQSVTECGDDGSTCLPPTTFDWENTPAATFGATVTYAGGAAEFGAVGDWDNGTDGQSYWVDVNGDGRPDHCYALAIPGENGAPIRDQLYCMLTQPGSAAPVAVHVMNSKPLSAYSFADVNGDGVADICAYYCVSLVGATDAFHHAWDLMNEERWPTLNVLASIQVDFDGSGKAGACSVTNGGSGTSYRLECGAITSQSAPKAPAINYGAVAAPCIGRLCEPLQFSWPDITGDGVPSFCRIVDSVIRCNKLWPTGLGLEVSTGVIDLGDRAGRAWVDVNGDGKADFCRVIASTPNQSNASGTLQCTLSTGTGFGETIVSATLDVGLSPPVYQDPHTGTYFSTFGRTWVDVNGDGKPDYCRVIGVSTACTLSTGTGFGSTLTLASGTSPADAMLVDVSADGRTDFCWYTNGQGAECHVAAGTIPDLLLSVTDGLGATTSLEYRPISDASVYAKGSGATFPTIDLQSTTHVVQRLQASNGVGGTMDTTYSYEGAKTHLQGRGFQGFSAVVSTGPTGIVSRAEANTAFPLTGTRARTTTMHAGVTLSDTTIGYVSKVGTGSAPLASYLVFQSLSVAKSNDLNGQFVNWVEGGSCGATYIGSTFSGWTDTTDCIATFYDTYGNPLRSDTIHMTASGTPDGYSQSSATAYANDVPNWILGRPTSLTTTSRIPGQADSVRATASSYFDANPGLGLLKQNIIEPADVASLRLVNDYTYDSFGNVKTKVVSGPNIAARTEATYTYDAQGRFALTQANALGHTETRTWDPRFGVLNTLQDPNLLTTSWSYDLFGRKLTERRPDGTRTTLAYNPCAGCASGSAYSIVRTETVIATGATADPATRSYYDTLGRSIVSVHLGFAGQEVFRETLYDSVGRVGYSSSNHFASDPLLRWTQFDYDALGRATRTTAPDNTVTSAEFNGRSSSTTNHYGVRNSRTINSQGQVVSIVDAEGSADASTVDYEFDHWGSLAKTTDALGNVTRMGYDLRGRKTQLVDRDMGTWNYTVDNLGQVINQTDAKGQATAFTYDLLGRMTRRLEPDLDSKWFFETNAAGVTCAQGIGKLCEATATNGYLRRHEYDSVGRLSRQTHRLDADYVAQWLYNAAGKLDTKTFPASTGVAPFAAPLVIKYNYNSNGFLQSLTNSATGAAYWTRTSENVDGNLTTEVYGNALIGTRGYDPTMGRLLSLQAGTSDAPGSVQDQTYHYDSLGRLDQRQDSNAATSETFGYDSLNRMSSASLTAAGVGGTQITTVAYDAIGNITSKTGVGTYSYNASGASSVRPHAVSGVAGTVNGIVDPGYSYDANGNMLTDGARSFTWTSFNMPSTLTKTEQAGSPGAGASLFLYGPEHQRVKQTWADASKTLTTYYLGEPQFEKEVNTQTGITEYKHYVTMDSRIVAIHTRTSNATEDVKYLIPDHLGSTSVVTDASGAVIERQAYDAWGDRRTASGAGVGAADPGHLIQPTGTDRGYTGHEHLDQGNMGLVHMNGRVYDPTLARFISADPNVPGAFSTQKFNRFSYVSNSPLNATDPSGYFEADNTAAGSSASIRVGSFGFGWTTVWSSGSDSSTSGGETSARTERTMSTPGQENSSTPAGNGSGFSTAATDKAGSGSGTTEAANGAEQERTALDRAFPRGDFFRTAGEAVGAIAAYIAGIWTGNEVLKNVALEGMRENVTSTDGIGAAAMLATSSRGGGGAKGIAETTTVIGRVKDLKNLPAGEKSLLDRLPNLGDPKANWAQNSGVLRQEMGRGLPIRDASPGDSAGQFLNAERYLLKERGWKLDAQTNSWLPPKP